MSRLQLLIYPSRYLSRVVRVMIIAAMAALVLVDVLHRYSTGFDGHALYGAALAQSIAIWGIYALLFDTSLPGLGGQFEPNSEASQAVRFFAGGPTFLVTYSAFFFAFR